MQISGACHCGNVTLALEWPDGATEMPVRECGCTFCRKHAGSWTSHRDSTLVVTVADESAVSRYEFGTGTAEFYVCARCGAVPVAISDIDGRLYAVVNVNTLEGIDALSLARVSTDFEGEDTGGRLDRRKRNWIPEVRVSVTGALGQRISHE